MRATLAAAWGRRNADVALGGSGVDVAVSSRRRPPVASSCPAPPSRPARDFRHRGNGPLGGWGVLRARPTIGSRSIQAVCSHGQYMYKIVATEQLSPNVTRLVVEAPRIAEIRRPGQFVIVRLGPGAERIPLTIADSDGEAGTITLIIQSVGKSTSDLVALQPGDAITDVAGPLGSPTELIESGHAVCVGGGVGTAVILPIAQELARRRRPRHQHHRRPVARVGDPRARAGAVQPRHRLHGRRQLRPARLRDAGPGGRPPRRRRRRLCRRSRTHDEGRE